MKKQLQVLVLMLKYLVLVAFLLAAAAALHLLYYTWSSSPGTQAIFIKTAVPKATVVLQMEGADYER